jgi:DNA invertase Pin-like site-specific DNA recombinase
LFEMMWPVSHTHKPSVVTEPAQRPVRCAVYARVSVADNQATEFNSLAAQVEICEEYVANRAGMGWVLAGPPYTDDGESAKNLQRPGLSALMELIQQGEVEVVVVYKLDRLCRSLLDLTEVLLPLLNFKGVELVSVTQHLDSHSPSGRLSFNLLASFAEFERETILGRTRDKFSATRRQGRWQGGGTPLGYDVNFEERVVVNKPDASLVREIFKRYAASDTMAELMDWLDGRSPVRLRTLFDQEPRQSARSRDEQHTRPMVLWHEGPHWR